MQWFAQFSSIGSTGSVSPQAQQKCDCFNNISDYDISDCSLAPWSSQSSPFSLGRPRLRRVAGVVSHDLSELGSVTRGRAHRNMATVTQLHIWNNKFQLTFWSTKQQWKFFICDCNFIPSQQSGSSLISIPISTLSWYMREFKFQQFYSPFNW